MESPFPEPVPTGTRLIETFGWWPGEGARGLDLHLARMARSAGVLGFAFDPGKARDQVAGLTGLAALRCRLTLGDDGDIALTTAVLPPAPADPWRVAIHPQRLNSHDPWLAHKTTNRALYDTARAALPRGVDEYMFLNEQGDACEGTISNLFVTLVDGRKVTPPLASGLLPGILRGQLLACGAVTEDRVTLDMLRTARAVSFGNALRGEIPARLLI